MPVLFFIESIPLRNRLSGHIWLSSQISQLIRVVGATEAPDPDVRILCNSLVVEHLKNEKAAVLPSLIPFSDHLESLFYSRSNLWRKSSDGEGGIASWLRYVEGNDTDLSEALHRELNLIKASSFDFDVLAYWGSNGALANPALSKQVPGVVSVAMELGPTRPPFEQTLYADPHGVNGNSCIASLDTDTFLKFATKNLSEIKVCNSIKMANGRTLYQSIPAARSNEVDSFFAPLKARYDRVVLFPNQLADDANSLLFSRGHSSFTALKALCNHPSLEGGIVVLKPHPKSSNNAFNLQAWRVLMRNVNEELSDKVVLCDLEIAEEDYISFLQSFDAVVGINSSVLFEAALLGVPVAPIGSTGFFPSDAHLWLDAALSDWGGDAKKAAQLSAYLNISYLLPPRKMLSDKASFVKYVSLIARAYNQNAKNTLRDILAEQDKAYPRNEATIQWMGQSLYHRKGFNGGPRQNFPTRVTSYRQGLAGDRFSIEYIDTPTVDDLVVYLDSATINDTTITLRAHAVTDKGEPPHMFIIKSGGFIQGTKPTEVRPARARDQGFQANLKIGVSLTLDVASTDFPLYANFSFYAAFENGRAVEIVLPGPFRRNLEQAIYSEADPVDSVNPENASNPASEVTVL